MLPLPISEGWIWENMLDFRLLDLIAELIVACEPPPKRGPGHPRSEIVRVLATLRRFLREGLPWRSLRATIEQGQRLDPAAVPDILGRERSASQGACAAGGD